MKTFQRALLFAGLFLVVLGLITIFASKAAQRTGDPLPEPAPVPHDWATYSSAGVTFRYPEQLPTTYMRATEWPPQVTISEEAFACDTGSEMGETRAAIIDGASYCITVSGEGAAGSVYTAYTYRTPREEGTLSLAFMIRATQCGNYDDPQRTACEQERESFDVDALADGIARSVTTQ